jgi:hypothetical protein
MQNLNEETITSAVLSHRPIQTTAAAIENKVPALHFREVVVDSIVG